MFTGNVSLGGIDLYDTYGLLAVSMDDGLEKIHFGLDQEVVEESIPMVDKPVFFGVNRKPIEFELSFALDNNKAWTYDMKHEFVRLFFKSYYQEIRFERIPQVFYRVICISKPTQAMNAIDHGYVTLKFRTDAPYAYSETKIITRNITGATEANPYVLEIENNCNTSTFYFPEIEFKTVGTEFKMLNNRDKGRVFEFSGLVSGEEVYVNNEKRKVLGNQPFPDNYRLSKFNENWLRLRQGNNKLLIYTDCIFTIKMENPIAL